MDYFFHIPNIKYFFWYLKQMYLKLIIYTTFYQKKCILFVLVENKSNKISYCFELLGENIKYHRKRKNITLEELGLAIGLDKSAIFHIEKGKPITLRTLLKITAYLEVPVLDLVRDFPNLTKDDLSI